MAKGPLGGNWAHFVNLIGAGIQKKERPQIEIIIEYLINDPMLKNGLIKIVELLKENKAKPAWFTTSHYKCKHKGGVAFQIKIGDGFKLRENEIFITIHTTAAANMTQFEQFITEEMRNIVINSANFNVCNSCGRPEHSPCNKIVDFEFNGKQYNGICVGNINVNFLLDSNTPNLSEQFQMIEDFIRAKIKFNSISHSK